MTCSIFGALFVEQQLLFHFNMHSRLVILATKQFAIAEKVSRGMPAAPSTAASAR
jgi:hypothetical protein